LILDLDGQDHYDPKQEPTSVTVGELKAAGADPYDLAPLTVRPARAKSKQ
jgi:hypothetical protein